MSTLQSRDTMDVGKGPGKTRWKEGQVTSTERPRQPRTMAVMPQNSCILLPQKVLKS